MIAKAREINKAHTTFIDTIIRYEHKGRIHAEINQIRSDQGGTVTGRFSYNNPNLQQLPARNKDLGPLIRSLFLSEEKHTWGCFDYSQQEPRLVVHYASLHQFPSVYPVIDSYKNNPNTDFHHIVADMANIPRSQAKTINLGLFYGMGKTKLQAELGVSKEKAAILFIAHTMAGVKNKAKRPITFSFNGGPGSSSVWLHLGVLGPRRVLMTNEGEMPKPPFQLTDNEHSVLDETDLVFIDPMSSGFSRPVEGEKSKEWHTFQKDIASVGDFIRLYTTRYNR